MAYIPGSSFIPKETAVGTTPKVLKRRRTFHIFGFIASLSLIVSLLAAVGVFAYEKYLENELKGVQVELTQKKSENMESKLVEIAVFDRQLNVAKSLLDNHLAPTRIFTALESLTKTTIAFTSFEYNYDPGSIAKLEVNGSTEELSSVAVQKLEFADNDFFTDFIVDGVSLALSEGTDGAPVAESENPFEKAVSFDISGSLNKKAIQYTGEDSVAPEDILLPVTETGSTETSNQSGS